MHPRTEARITDLAEARRAAVLGQLDLVIARLSTLPRLVCIEQLVAHCRMIRAHIAEARISAQETDALTERLTAQLNLINDAILWPLLIGLTGIAGKYRYILRPG